MIDSAMQHRARARHPSSGPPFPKALQQLWASIRIAVVFPRASPSHANPGIPRPHSSLCLRSLFASSQSSKFSASTTPLLVAHARIPWLSAQSAQQTSRQVHIPPCKFLKAFHKVSCALCEGFNKLSWVVLVREVVQILASVPRVPLSAQM